MNPNDKVKIKPTPFGWKQIEAKHAMPYYGRLPEIDSDGFIAGQFWHLMSYFVWDGLPGADRSPFSEMIADDDDVPATEVAQANLW